MSDDSDYRFGMFELSARRQVLISAGAPVRVGSRALIILTVLVEAAGDLVTREKLIAAAWPTTFVDDSNLKVNVANLRRALETVDPGQDYIATVPGRGYRFIASVQRIPTGVSGLPPKIPLIGRADDLAAVQELLSKNPVVTIAGPGGIGKTVLATAAAHTMAAHFSGGVIFADLAKISEPLFIAAALALALELRTVGEDPLAEVIHSLDGQRKLLVIDNCEHLLPSVASVIDRLSVRLEDVRILATSREPLRIRDEHVYRLNPLNSDPRSSPTSSEAWAYPAVELFVTRAFERTGYQLSDTDAPHVAEICRRLDGIPLAIELAATRIGALTPARLLEMLDDRFKILAYGSGCKAPLRQQTLHATLDWSHSLLSDSEASFVRALSVFTGEFGVEGAIALLSDDAPPDTAVDMLSSLAAKSFLVIDWQESVVTYRLLDTMRAYLLERLRFSEEENDARHRHAIFMCALLERAGTPVATVATRDRRAKFGRWLEDLRAALAWTLNSEQDATLGIRLAVAALPLWSELSLLDECRETSERALAQLDASSLPDPRMRAHLLLGLAIADNYVPEDAGAHRRTWESALQAARAVDDSDLVAQVLSGLARCEMFTGRHKDALRHIRELRSIAKGLGSSWAGDEGDLLLSHGEIYTARFPKALARLKQLVERETRHQLSFRCGMQQVTPHLQLAVNFAAVLWLTGSPARAASAADAAMRDAQEVGHQQSLCEILAKGVALVALWNGHVDRASRYAAELARLVALYRLPIWKPVSVCLDALVACAEGREVHAWELVAACDAMLALPPPLIRPIYLVMVADELIKRGRLVEARRPIDAVRARIEASQGESWTIPELLRVEAALSSHSGDVRTAEELLLQSLRMADEAGATGWSLRTAFSLAHLQRGAGRPRDAVAVLTPIIARVVDGAGTRDFDDAQQLLLQLSGDRNGEFASWGSRSTMTSVRAAVHLDSRSGSPQWQRVEAAEV
jgi:predicted ATPase/DNA-binding winged helix-turn-helix (wHTH) protein